MDLIKKLQDTFPYLREEKVAEILSMGTFMPLNEGDVFIKAGERSNKIGLVVQGMMRNYTINDKGEEITVLFATEFRAIAPYASIFLNRPASETSQAVEATILFVIDHKNLKALTLTDPIFSRLYIDMVEVAFVDAIQRIEDFTEKNPEERYRRLLDNHGFLIERAPLKYVASYLGITPVSLSRIRKRITQSGN